MSVGQAVGRRARRFHDEGQRGRQLGPCNDNAVAKPLLEKTKAVLRPKTLWADAGYDAEWVHEFCRDDWKIQRWIPPAVHRADGKVREIPFK